MDIIIVDDEPLARDRLRRMLRDESDYRVVAQAATAEETLAAMQEWNPDMVLLDIQMPGDTGLQAAAQLAALDNPPAIIFCTAYQQYALEAFAVNAQNYLLKPVRKEQLLQALDKAQRLNRAQRQQLAAVPGTAAVKTTQPTIASAASSAPVTGTPTGAATALPSVAAEARTHISARTRRGLELISLDKVLFFAADQKYVTVYHEGGEILIDDTLKDLEREFADRLVRIHRSLLVVLARVEAMEKNRLGQFELRLRGTDQRPVVSRRHASHLRELLSSL
jgi:two-component system response regulator AlgR